MDRSYSMASTSDKRPQIGSATSDASLTKGSLPLLLFHVRVVTNFAILKTRTISFVLQHSQLFENKFLRVTNASL